MEEMQLATGNPVYRHLFDFWLKIFAVSFGLGVVSGIVMAFQFGTNWSVPAEKTGSIQGPPSAAWQRGDVGAKECRSRWRLWWSSSRFSCSLRAFGRTRFRTR